MTDYHTLAPQLAALTAERDRLEKALALLRDTDAFRRAELDDTDAALAELRERYERIRTAPFTHPCH